MKYNIVEVDLNQNEANRKWFNFNILMRAHLGCNVVSL